jgi:heat-inducible transcriptional repressor
MVQAMAQSSPNIMKATLTTREQKVLWATVDRYIATAEPVGSKVLLEEYKFDISAATIRNVMGVLDKFGLLYQPHTSAGRIPSHSGYRVYVDELISPPDDLSSHMHQKLSQSIHLTTNCSLEMLLRSVAHILATLSGCIALIAVPHVQSSKIRHIQLIEIDARKVTIVAVSDSYHTASVLVDLPASPDTSSLSEELQILNNFLNARLRDRPWHDLANLNWLDLDAQFRKYATVLEQPLRELTRVCNPPEMGQIFISGLTELLRQPEFSQLSQVKAIVQLLEENQADLFPLIFQQPELSDRRRVKVKIGSEISLEPIQNCTLISCTYNNFNNNESTVAGSVSVLGPTRLAYERAIASVQAVADHLSGTITQR